MSFCYLRHYFLPYPTTSFSLLLLYVNDPFHMYYVTVCIEDLNVDVFTSLVTLTPSNLTTLTLNGNY